MSHSRTASVQPRQAMDMCNVSSASLEVGIAKMEGWGADGQWTSLQVKIFRTGSDTRMRWSAEKEGNLHESKRTSRRAVNDTKIPSPR